MNQELLNQLNELVKRKEACTLFIEQCTNILANDPQGTAKVVGDDVFDNIMCYEINALKGALAEIDVEILQYEIIKLGEPSTQVHTQEVKNATKDMDRGNQVSEIQETIASLQEKTFLSEKPLVDVRNPAVRVKFEERQDDGDFIIHIDKPAKKQSKAKLK